jgi:homopolymeric O-antigen transport system permease protein
MSSAPGVRSLRSGFPIGLDYVLLSWWNHRAMIRGLVVRDIVGRYRGSFFGIAWSLIQPLTMLAIYTFVFGGIFRARWGASTSTSDFALALFAGLIVFNFFAECVNRSTSQILVNPNFVKKVVFPLEILPWTIVGTALFHFAVGAAVWIVFSLFIRGVPSPSILFLPLIMAPLVLMVVGLAWFLSSLGVFVRDVSQLVGLLTSALMFLSPVFYDVSVVPAGLRWLFRLNPLTFIIVQARRVMLDGLLPDAAGLAVHLAIGLLVAWLGLAWFQRTRHGFADVL